MDPIILDWVDLIPLLGILGAGLALWITIRSGKARPPTVVSPSEAQTADREARADSLEEAVDAVGPHSDGTDSPEATDAEVDGWIEDKD